jgi:hypothetical protein
MMDKAICIDCKTANETRAWIDENPELFRDYREMYPRINVNDVEFLSKTGNTRVLCGECGKYSDDFSIQKILRMRHGCLDCSKAGTAKLRTKDIDKFIADATRVHGAKYDYSKSIYINAHEKLIVGCGVHGDFEVTPSSHTNTGSGCPKCMNDAASERLRMTTEDFIARAREVHGDYYNYGEVVYGKNGRDKVIISCAGGHRFEQSPEDHLVGKGCITCAGTKQYTTAEFIVRAQAVHGAKYDYSEVEYKANDQRVKIKCAKHGMFKQSFVSHVLNKTVCTVCSPRTSKPELYIYETMYAWGLKFKFQKRFNDCKDQTYLAFDFYIPIPNKPGIIVEYDGAQHYKQVELWGGEEGFIIQQRRDGIKNAYCAENNIKLIRIRYDADLDTELGIIKQMCIDEGLIQ